MGGRNSGYQVKYYAVSVGRTNGVFTDWQECQNSVHRYPGNVYRAFWHPYDAMDFLLRGEDAYYISRQYGQFEGRHSIAQFHRQRLGRPQEFSIAVGDTITGYVI